MSGIHRDFIASNHRFVLMGNTSRMRNVRRGLRRLGKAAWLVDEQLRDNAARGTYRSLANLPAEPDAALCEGAAGDVCEFVRHIADHGISSLWLCVLGRGVTEAVATARGRGVEPIYGECPVLYLPIDLPGHWCHRLAWKLAGKY